MTPLSAELIVAPAALMVLLAMIWFRRHRDARVATAQIPNEDEFDDRFKGFMSSRRRGARKHARVGGDAATTGVIPAVAIVETAATDAPTPAPAKSPSDDAIFGPTIAAADEPNWESMRLPHVPETQELAHETAPEIATPPVAHTPAAHDDELITRPGWPLPGDLEAWESADLIPVPAPDPPEPGFGQWAEIAAARTEEPVDANDHAHGPGEPSGTDAAAETIVLGAPYPAPAMSPPVSFTGAMEPPTGTIAEPPYTSFGDGVDSLGQPAQPTTPSTDPSFWEIGPVSEPATAGAEPRVSATSADATDTWPPQASTTGERVWGPGAPEPDPTRSGDAATTIDTAARGAEIGSDDWWAAEAASVVPEPTAVPDARSLPSADPSGIQRPAVAGAPAEADWWDATPTAQPHGDDAWWVTPPANTSFGDLPMSTGQGAPQTAAGPAELVGATAVATGAVGGSAGAPQARLLPRLDASAQNRQTAGRFAVGGSAVATGDGAFTRVRFRSALARPILGWAIGDGPHHAPGTLVLVVDAVLNCSTAGLSVLQEDADPNRPDGFTLSLSSDGPGPFAVSGSYYVVTG